MNSASLKTLNYRDGKHTLQVIPKKGESMGTCSTFNEKYICCKVNVLRSIHNCPFNCTYCFLQNYLNDGGIKVISDIDSLMKEVKGKITGEPWRLFRIGTWELGDSLALEQETGQASRLIKEFSVLKNAVLELKTKSDSVDPVLNLDHNQKTVISWSLNTDYIITREEQKTAPLKRRLDAMCKAVKAGYLLGAHFDPMIFYEGWEEGYRDLVRLVFNAVPPERFAWLSIGSLRFNPEMKKKIENNYPDSKLTSAEMISGDDGKMRYVKPLRLKMYKLLYNEMKKYLRKDNLVYFCMERWDVWESIMGCHPRSIGQLDYLFAKSLYERYSLTEFPPEQKLYEEGLTENNCFNNIYKL